MNWFNKINNQMLHWAARPSVKLEKSNRVVRVEDSKIISVDNSIFYFDGYPIHDPINFYSICIIDNALVTMSDDHLIPC